MVRRRRRRREEGEEEEEKPGEMGGKERAKEHWLIIEKEHKYDGLVCFTMFSEEKKKRRQE